jgi:hypothetical protein
MSTIYLYVKQHSITKLKYFGKTQSSNPYKYPGSGSYWSKHIRKHGKSHILTLEIWGFDDQQLCTEFALKFSEENNIVESKDWANLRPENGIDGLPKGFNGHMTEERRKQNSERWLNNNPNNLPGARERMSKRVAGDKNPAKRTEVREKMKGTKGRALPHNHYTGWTQTTKNKISNSLKGHVRSAESIAKQKESKKDLAWVHNKIDKPKQIKKNLLDDYFANGYSKGRGPKEFW